MIQPGALADNRYRHSKYISKAATKTLNCMCNIFKDMKDKTQKFERDLETTKRMLEILELKNVITEVVNSFNGLIERWIHLKKELGK